MAIKIAKIFRNLFSNLADNFIYGTKFLVPAVELLTRPLTFLYPLSHWCQITLLSVLVCIKCVHCFISFHMVVVLTD